MAERQDGVHRSDTMMAGFYIQNNTSIGLRCFAWGIVFGLGSLYQLLSNAIVLGDGLRLHGHQSSRRQLLHVRDRALGF